MSLLSGSPGTPRYRGDIWIRCSPLRSRHLLIGLGCSLRLNSDSPKGHGRYRAEADRSPLRAQRSGLAHPPAQRRTGVRVCIVLERGIASILPSPSSTFRWGRSVGFRAGTGAATDTGRGICLATWTVPPTRSRYRHRSPGPSYRPVPGRMKLVVAFGVDAPGIAIANRRGEDLDPGTLGDTEGTPPVGLRGDDARDPSAM